MRVVQIAMRSCTSSLRASPCTGRCRVQEASFARPECKDIPSIEAFHISFVSLIPKAHNKNFGKQRYKKRMGKPLMKNPWGERRERKKLKNEEDRKQVENGTNV